MSSTLVSRRDFMQRSLAGGVALAAGPFILPASASGANERIGIAVIGPGRQGGGLLGSAGKSKDARIVAIADVNLVRARQKAAPYKAEVYKDYRKLLERKDVDAIITATPEHWRALTCIHACQAGKDVYAEKPMTLTIREGRLMVQAVRKYGRVFQCGSQQRSQIENHIGCQLVREGLIGKISKVIAYNYPSPWNCALPAQNIPDELDWDLWCGPVEPVPFNADLYAPRAKPGWLSFRPYSGGEMTGWGAHGFDQIQCALGMDESGPVEAWVEGEKFNPPTYTAPESSARGNKTCAAPKLFYRYATGTIMELAAGPHGGGIFIGEKGSISIDRGKCKSDPADLVAEKLAKGIAEHRAAAKSRKSSVEDPAPPSSTLTDNVKMAATPPLNGGHMQNWFDCIRSRARPIADVEIGHRSATVCHLGNIARWTGKRLKWDPVQEKFDDAEANTYLDRVRRKPYELPENV
jgi:predicted dehydrogenase